MSEEEEKCREMPESLERGAESACCSCLDNVAVGFRAVLSATVGMLRILGTVIEVLKEDERMVMSQSRR